MTSASRAGLRNPIRVSRQFRQAAGPPGAPSLPVHPTGPDRSASRRQVDGSVGPRRPADAMRSSPPVWPWSFSPAARNGRAACRAVRPAIAAHAVPIGVGRSTTPTSTPAPVPARCDRHHPHSERPPRPSGRRLGVRARAASVRDGTRPSREPQRPDSVTPTIERGAHQHRLFVKDLFEESACPPSRAV